MAMSDFRKTGDYLRRKYNGAIEVTMNQDGTGFAVANKAFRKATKNDLVYFENSPDYCLQDKSAGETIAREPLKGPWRLMDVDGLPRPFLCFVYVAYMVMLEWCVYMFMHERCVCVCV